MTTITIYGSDNSILHSDTYPAQWGIVALQATARRWMKYVNGVRYSIDGGGVQYQSKVRKVAA